MKGLTQWGDLRRADGGSGGGGGGPEGCRRLEDLAGKDAGSFALADGDQRRLTRDGKVTRLSLTSVKPILFWFNGVGS